MNEYGPLFDMASDKDNVLLKAYEDMLPAVQELAPWIINYKDGNGKNIRKSRRNREQRFAKIRQDMEARKNNIT